MNNYPVPVSIGEVLPKKHYNSYGSSLMVPEYTSISFEEEKAITPFNRNFLHVMVAVVVIALAVFAVQKIMEQRRRNSS